MRDSERRLAGRTLGFGAVLLLGLAGCGDLTGPGERSGRARGDPVVMEGITVHPPPGGCRSGSCGGESPGGRAPSDGNDGSNREGGGGPAATPAGDGSKCLAALTALATAATVELGAFDRYQQETAQHTAASRLYADRQRKFAADGLTQAERRELAQLKAEVDRERREMQEAALALRHAKRASNAAAALAALACATGA